jgi:hypothetical protein
MELLLDGCLRIARMESDIASLNFYFPTTLISSIDYSRYDLFCAHQCLNALHRKPHDDLLYLMLRLFLAGRMVLGAIELGEMMLTSSPFSGSKSPCSTPR